jgi:hypothetical protein
MMSRKKSSGLNAFVVSGCFFLFFFFFSHGIDGTRADVHTLYSRKGYSWNLAITMECGLSLYGERLRLDGEPGVLLVLYTLMYFWLYMYIFFDGTASVRSLDWAKRLLGDNYKAAIAISYHIEVVSQGFNRNYSDYLCIKVWYIHTYIHL